MAMARDEFFTTFIHRLIIGGTMAGIAWGIITRDKTRFCLRPIAEAASCCPLFTDKMPANYSHVGFIGLILPEAKIIDVRRDPLATCVANYRQLFAKGKNQSYDLVELGEYYLQYVALMNHWDEVMPGRVLRVVYEDVVGDLEQQVRRILDFCGLPFEQSCIDYYKSERPVNTASSEQVRQPIYSGALEHWRKYEKYLDELKVSLGPVLDRYPI